MDEVGSPPSADGDPAPTTFGHNAVGDLRDGLIAEEGVVANVVSELALHSLSDSEGGGARVGLVEGQHGNGQTRAIGVCGGIGELRFSDLIARPLVEGAAGGGGLRVLRREVSRSAWSGGSKSQTLASGGEGEALGGRGAALVDGVVWLTSVDAQRDGRRRDAEVGAEHWQDCSEVEELLPRGVV